MMSRKKVNYTELCSKLQTAASHNGVAIVHSFAKGCCFQINHETQEIVIILDSTIKTHKEKAFVLAHEFGHYYTLLEKEDTRSNLPFRLKRRKEAATEEQANRFAIKLLTLLGVGDATDSYTSFYIKEKKKLQEKLKRH